MGISKPENLDDLSSANLLQQYEQDLVGTDRFSPEDITPILLGLYGEVGSILAASKKYRREKSAYPTYINLFEEEFGDAFWYFAALCRRLNVRLTDIFDQISSEVGIEVISVSDQVYPSAPRMITPSQVEQLDSVLIDLGYMTAQLLKIQKDAFDVKDKLLNFARLYHQAIQLTGLLFANVLKSNLTKTLGRFSMPSASALPDFDGSFPEEEQLPRRFEIHISQRKSGQSYLRWNGVFIGAPLTDNIKDADDYRFHDVFHMAHAAVLHWSPTFRDLIKQKRKSDPIVDETQDGGRAIVVEEGLTAWLFSYSKGLNYFEGHDSVSFDALKTIQKFVHGYEVERCPLKLWEDAILQGYSVFRQVRKNNGGIVIGDRDKREISYCPLGG
ncbi:MAG: pyrophosphatase [Nitrospira sp.]|nr:pyrophosphatase [Nitrospira sp.]